MNRLGYYSLVVSEIPLALDIFEEVGEPYIELDNGQWTQKWPVNQMSEEKKSQIRENSKNNFIKIKDDEKARFEGLRDTLTEEEITAWNTYISEMETTISTTEDFTTVSVPVAPDSDTFSVERIGE